MSGEQRCRGGGTRQVLVNRGQNIFIQTNTNLPKYSRISFRHIFQVNVYSRVPNVTVVPKSVKGNFFLKINKAVGDLQQNVQNEDMQEGKTTEKE